ILYGYSIPGYSGQGIRTYLTLKYTVIKGFIDIWLRYANFAYADRDVIGSSYDEIQGSNKSEVKFQVRIKF
ncbi:MAG: helix-hairpin-helix domain-containing protein, partial [Bacteroidetes bacterium]